MGILWTIKQAFKDSHYTEPATESLQRTSEDHELYYSFPLDDLAIVIPTFIVWLLQRHTLQNAVTLRRSLRPSLASTRPTLHRHLHCFEMKDAAGSRQGSGCPHPLVRQAACIGVSGPGMQAGQTKIRSVRSLGRAISRSLISLIRLRSSRRYG